MARTKSGREIACVQVAVKMTPTEAQRLRSLSDRAGLTVSQTLRALVAVADVEPVISWRPTLAGGAQ